MTAPTLPTALTYGQVRWQVMTTLPDTSADPDALPQPTPVAGTVVFTPSASLLLAGGASPVTVIGAPQVYALDGAGVLRDGEGRALISLVATDSPGVNPTGWTWTVSYKLTGYSRASFSFALPTGAVVDLTTIAPLPASNGAAVSGPPPTRSGLGLDQVDNTSDAAKPISTAVRAALDVRPPVFPTLEGLMLTGYGHSYLDPAARPNGIGPAQRYFDRVANRLALVQDNNGIGGYHMQDAVLDAIGNRDATKKWTLGERGVAIIDAVTNDAGTFGATAAALTAWEQSFRALCWFLSADSTYFAEDRNAALTYSAGWTDLANGDYSGGTLKQLGQGTSGTATATLVGPGKYAFAFASLSTGADMEVLVDGSVVKTFSTVGGIACGHNGPSGARSFGSLVAPFDVPAGSHTVVLRNKAGGAFAAGVLLDYLGRRNTIDPVQIFVPKAVYTSNGVADSVYDAYNARMATVVAEYANVHIVDTAGWDKATMIGADGVHPSRLGTEFLAAKVTAAILTAYGLAL